MFKKNMKVKTIIGLTSMMVLSSVTLANNKVIKELIKDDIFIYRGNLKMVDSKLNTADIRGSSNLSSNQFKGEVDIDGSIDVRENIFMGKTELKGGIKSSNNKFDDKLTIQGAFKDKESIFSGDIILIGKAVFEDSTIEGTMYVLIVSSLIKWHQN